MSKSPTPAVEVTREDDWLLNQLEQWPTRIDPERTTNIEYLMKEAAKRLRTRSNEDSVRGEFEARHCPGIPTDCCDYGVISHATGKEVCRVWERDDAEQIARLLNAALPAPGPAAEGVMVPREATEEMIEDQGAREIAGLTDDQRHWLILTVLAVIGSEPQRRAFIAGYNGDVRPSPASDQMREMHKRGRTVRSLLLASPSVTK